MITEKLKELVIQEVTNLKKYATKDELNRLDFKRLDPNSVGFCIYGQMTGECYSDRASQLLNKCAKPYTTGIKPDSGKSNHPVFYSWEYYKERHFSPIEFYICQENAQNETLIKFLKSEISELTTEML